MPPGSPMPEDFFGEAVAERYDDDDAHMSSAEVVAPAVDLLAELAAGGRALELGIGTGRIALPLSQRGVPVHGIDLSTSMVARLQAKHGSEAIGVTIGDFSTTQVDGTFSVVYLVFNTIMNLTTQDAQVECFRNAAAHLDPGGHFVIEVSVPDLQRLPPGDLYRPFEVSADHLGFDEYDVLTQGLISHHLSRIGEAFERNSVPFRYVWPSELDLMARLAGLTWRAVGRTGRARCSPRRALSTSRSGGRLRAQTAPVARRGDERVGMLASACPEADGGRLIALSGWQWMYREGAEPSRVRKSRGDGEVRRVLAVSVEAAGIEPASADAPV